MNAPIRYFTAIYGDEYRRIAAYSEQDARERAAELLDKAMTSFYEVFPLELREEHQGGAV